MKLEIPEGADRRRLAVAAHEVGHFLGWHTAGFRVREIRVRGHGASTRGRVELGTIRINSLGQARGYLVGLLAGRAADIRWCRATGVPFEQHRCRGDLTQLKRLRGRHGDLFRQFPVRDLAIEARELVRVQWGRVVRLTPKLAEAGRLAT